MSLRSVCADLQEFSDHLAAGNVGGIAQVIESAGAFREEMLEYADISPATLYKVTVRVPDEPGVIAQVMTALGEAEINVEDLTLHHMSRSVGGDLEIFVSGEEVAERAATLLGALGYPSRVGPSGDGAE